MKKKLTEQQILKDLLNLIKTKRINLFFLSLFFCFLCANESHAQAKRITMSMKNATLEQVLDKIEQEMKYTFIYTDSTVDVSRKIDFNVKSKSIQEILELLFKGTNIQYSIVENQIILSTHSSLSAQIARTKVIGTVKDANGDILIGVSIIEKGTSNGTLSDVNGNFILNVSSGSILVFSYIGYDSQEVAVANKTMIEVVLKEDVKTLDEVVVVGYGVTKKNNLTGAVESVKSADLEKVNVVNTMNALSGKVPGLILKQTSGKPGDNDPLLNIRGFGSPLIIIDGTQQGSFGNLDMEEIESINVLKDASAAIYGVQAGNGVILVTTKRGGTGKPKISFNTSFTASKLTKYPKMMNAGEYAELYNEAQLNDGVSSENLRFSGEAIAHLKNQDDPLNYPNTNWFDVATRKYAPQQKHNLNVEGGNDQVKYFFSLGYATEGGLWKSGDSKFKRYNVRSNIDVKINKYLTASVDLAGRKENRNNPNMSVNDIFLNILRSQPIYHATYPDPTKHAALGRVGANGLISTQKNVVGYIDDERNYFTGTFKLRYDFPFLKNLYAEGRMTYYKDETFVKNWSQQYSTYNYDNTNDIYTLVSVNGQNSLRENQYHTRRTTYVYSLNYENTFDKHDVKAMFLFEGINDDGNDLSGSRINFISTAVQQLFAGGKDNQLTSGSAWENGRASYIGRLNYIYDSKYLFESTVRYDGSPKFGKGNRWGFFPSVSLGWIISNERFMSRFNWLDNLKLRLSYSNTGNDATGNFQYLTGYTFADTYIVGNSPQQTIVSTGLANPYITWEDMNTYNIGLEARFLGSFSAALDIFYRKREGMLATRGSSLPYSFGATLPAENINSQDNRGFEFVLGYRKRFGDFSMDLSGNMSYARAKWIHYEEPEYIDKDQIRINKKSGKWVDQTYGYLADGFFESQEQINNWPIKQDGANNSTLKPGDLIYKDLNGDNVIDWRDQDAIGKGEMPNWYYGFNTDFAWKNFSLNMLWQGAAGFNFQIISDAKSTFTQDQNGYKYFYKNRWTPENTNAAYPRASIGLPSNQDKLSDFWYKKAAYLRLKSLMLTYKLPENLLKSYGLPNVAVYVAGTNLVTFDNLSAFGYDPEAPNWNSGLYYPQQSTFTIGIKINL